MHQENFGESETWRALMLWATKPGMWAYHHGVRLDFSRSGKPTDNSFVETFNGSLQDECLNVSWFASLAEAQGLLEAWRQDYNESRPHSALNDLTPAEHARRIKEIRPA